MRKDQNKKEVKTPAQLEAESKVRIKLSMTEKKNPGLQPSDKVPAEKVAKRLVAKIKPKYEQEANRKRTREQAQTVEADKRATNTKKPG